MRLFQLAKTVMFILLSGTFAVLPAQAVVPAHAPSKLRLCQPCVMPSVPIAIPQRGLVLSYGDIFSDGSKWYSIDLERAEATRVLARLDRSTSKQNVVEQVTRPLSSGEISLLTQLVNRIWESKESLPSAMATDVVWNLWLLDAGDVRNEFGAGRPGGLAKEVEQIMRLLFEREVSVQPSVSP